MILPWLLYEKKSLRIKSASEKYMKKFLFSGKYLSKDGHNIVQCSPILHFKTDHF